MFFTLAIINKLILISIFYLILNNIEIFDQVFSQIKIYKSKVNSKIQALDVL